MARYLVQTKRLLCSNKEVLKLSPTRMSHCLEEHERALRFHFTGPGPYRISPYTLSDSSCPLFLSYLHEHFQPVQGSCTGSGHSTRTSTCNQMSPPHPRLPLFHCELIWDCQILPHIKDLQGNKHSVENAQWIYYFRRLPYSVSIPFQQSQCKLAIWIPCLPTNVKVLWLVSEKQELPLLEDTQNTQGNLSHTPYSASWRLANALGCTNAKCIALMIKLTSRGQSGAERDLVLSRAYSQLDLVTYLYKVLNKYIKKEMVPVISVSSLGKFWTSRSWPLVLAPRAVIQVNLFTHSPLSRNVQLAAAQATSGTMPAIYIKDNQPGFGARRQLLNQKK